MKNFMAFIMMSLVALVFTSCSGGDSENGENVSSEKENLDEVISAKVDMAKAELAKAVKAKNYVILNGTDIKVESNQVSWSEDKKEGTTQNYYIKEKFQLQFTDLRSRIVDGPETLHGQEFPVIITYNNQEYQTMALIENSEKGETKKFIGTGYTLIGKINAFNIGDKKVTGGQFSFSTYLNE